MIKTTVEKLANPIGFEIGVSDDVTQAELLNGFCKGLSNSMDDSERGTQLCYIVDKLDSKSDKIILELAEFIKIKSK